MRRIVAILAVQWGYPGDKVLPWFRINPYNHSGARLIKLIGHRNFLVTNACSDIVYSASAKGAPDAEWLQRNLTLLAPEVVLVCGSVARATFRRGMVGKAVRVLYMPHPAARMWSKRLMTRYTKLLKGVLSNEKAKANDNHHSSARSAAARR